MSALWHDDELTRPQRPLSPERIWKGINDQPFETEVYERPASFVDPYDMQDVVSELAAEQEERGLEFMRFMNGKPVPEVISTSAQDEALHAYVAREHYGTTAASKAPGPDRADVEVRESRLQHQRVSRASVSGPGKASVMTAARRDAERAADAQHVLEALAIPAASMPVAGVELAQAPTLPAMAQAVASVIGAGASAVELAAVGLTLDMNPMAPRRAFRQRALLSAESYSVELSAEGTAHPDDVDFG
jgi:hypothetical protein